MHLLIQQLLDIAADLLDALATSFTLVAHMEKCFFVLGAHRVASISKDFRIFFEPLGVLQILKLLSLLDTILGAHLLVLVVVFAL